MNVPVVVGTKSGEVILQGGSKKIDAWVQGNVYQGATAEGVYIRDYIYRTDRPPSLVGRDGRFFGKMHPQYPEVKAADIISIKACGAKGDGKADDTVAIQAALNKVGISSKCQFQICSQRLKKYGSTRVIFFDAGTYLIKKTITIPAGARIVGEAWSVLAGTGVAYQDVNNPRVVVRVGGKDSVGRVEISDIMFTMIGPGERRY